MYVHIRRRQVSPVYIMLVFDAQYNLACILCVPRILLFSNYMIMRFVYLLGSSCYVCPSFASWNDS